MVNINVYQRLGREVDFLEDIKINSENLIDVDSDGVPRIMLMRDGNNNVYELTIDANGDLSAIARGGISTGGGNENENKIDAPSSNLFYVGDGGGHVELTHTTSLIPADGDFTLHAAFHSEKSDAVIVSLGAENDNSKNIFMEVSGNLTEDRLAYRARNGAGGDKVEFIGSDLNLAKLKFVTLVKRGNTVREFYQDAVLLSPTASTLARHTLPFQNDVDFDTLRLFIPRASIFNQYRGWIDHVSLYNFALSQQQIAAIVDDPTAIVVNDVSPLIHLSGEIIAGVVQNSGSLSVTPQLIGGATSVRNDNLTNNLGGAGQVPNTAFGVGADGYNYGGLTPPVNVNNPSDLMKITLPVNSLGQRSGKAFEIHPSLSDKWENGDLRAESYRHAGLTNDINDDFYDIRVDDDGFTYHLAQTYNQGATTSGRAGGARLEARNLRNYPTNSVMHGIHFNTWFNPVNGYKVIIGQIHRKDRPTVKWTFEGIDDNFFKLRPLSKQNNSASDYQFTGVDGNVNSEVILDNIPKGAVVGYEELWENEELKLRAWIVTDKNDMLANRPATWFITIPNVTWDEYAYFKAFGPYAQSSGNPPSDYLFKTGCYGWMNLSPALIPSIASDKQVRWFDFSDESTITTSSGVITTIDDKWVDNVSLNGDGSSTTPAYGARAINLLKVADFDSDILEESVSNLPDSTTIFMVVQVDNDTQFTLVRDEGGNFPVVIFDGDTSAALNAGSGTPTYRKNGQYITINNRDEAHTALGSGTYIFTMENVDLSAYTKLKFGGAPSFDGAIGEVVIAKDLTAQEQLDIEEYLYNKWGIA